MKTKLMLLAAAVIAASLQSASAQTYWRLAGNGSDAAGAKLGTLGSNPLNLYTNGLQRATITTAGRVGIGITGPINILTVKASGGTPAASWTNVSTQIFYGFSEAANGEFNIGTATNTATQRSLIQGKRCRGTLAAPAAVQNNDYLASIVGSGYDGSAFQNPCEVDFYADGAPSAGHVPGRISFVTGTNISDRLERLKIGSTGDITVNTNQLFVQASTGNVGIGTTSPTYKLYVNGGSTPGIYSTTSGGYGVVGISSSSSGYGLYGSGGLLGVYATGNTYGVYANGGTYGTYSYGSTNGVYGYSSTSTSTSYGVNGSGYRGVNGTGTYGVFGTGTSYGVYGDGGDNYGVYGSGNAYGVWGNSTYLGVYGYAPSGSYGTYGYSNYIGAYGYGNSYGVYGVGNTSTSGTYGVYGRGYSYGVYGSGNIGIYASSSVSGGDGVRSNVSGSANYGVNTYSANSYGLYASTGVSGGVAAYFNGKISVSGTIYTSDGRLKKNIVTVDNAMDVINRLTPRNYEFRNDGSYAKMNLPTGKHYGFIAQELEKVLPTLVKETQFNTAKDGGEAVSPAPLTPDKDGKPVKPAAVQPVKEVKGEIIDYKGVEYIELIPIIVKGMQEQDKVIKTKDTKIDDLQLQVEKLQSALDNIKTLLVTKGLVSANELGALTGGSSASLARLDQNTPNPSDGTTTLRYYLPSTTGRAAIQITSVSGAVLKSFPINQSGSGQVTLNARDYPAGTYFYTLYVDGKVSDSKKMVLNR